MRASIDDLFNAAKVYSESSNQVREIIAELNKTMKALSEGWSDANTNSFIAYHKELDQYLDGCAEIMTAIATDMKEIAKKYEKAEADNIPQLLEERIDK